MVDLENKEVRTPGAEPPTPGSLGTGAYQPGRTRSGQPRSGPISGFAGQAAEVTSDVLELAELQLKLVRLDAADAVKRVIWPTGLLVFAVCMAIASLPVAFLGLAGGLEQVAGIEAWQAQLVVGALGVVIALVAVVVALRALSAAVTTFSRSTQELTKNVAWMKSLFRRT